MTNQDQDHHLAEVPDGILAYTYEQLMQATSLSRSTIQRAVRAGKLRPTWVTRSTVRFLKEDVMAWLLGCIVQPPSKEE